MPLQEIKGITLKGLLAILEVTTMDGLYNVTIEYLGLKKQDKFTESTICLGKDGAFLVMDSEGKSIRFVANNCKVEQIAAHVIIINGYTDKPRHMTAYCIYANARLDRQEEAAIAAWNTRANEKAHSCRVSEAKEA
jgi:hypothetical protein